ncbi:hypothetical protein [Piscinibacter sp.]|uniref:hypothetical protein n=1 Tax=Piscinibacter sp. TaxID=1903157 RepID=UPI002CE73977|nr:hypothetical protein [Albitalea sp.]HUG23904.1 hypothetical protein [Albitalea sp.]
MKMKTRLPAAMLLLTAPVVAYAQGTGVPHILFAAAGGGFVGGLLGALLACWLCNRRRDDNDMKKR